MPMADTLLKGFDEEMTLHMDITRGLEAVSRSLTAIAVSRGLLLFDHFLC